MDRTPMHSTPGKRLRLLRSLCGKTRAEIEQLYAIPEISLRQWENDKYRLTDKSALRCHHVYNSEGLHVSLEWIKQGVGLDPFFTKSLNKNLVQFSLQETNPDPYLYDQKLGDELNQLEEAHFFKKKHPDATILLVTQDEMAPFYIAGDYIGGIYLSTNDLDKAIGRDCIVELKNGSTIFRKLSKDALERLNLVCLNPMTIHPEPILFQPEILRAAPVIWHRRSQIK